MSEKEKPDLVIREEDKYKQEIELTFRKVFGYHLEAELSRSGQNKTPEERKAFTDRRLPVYLDALTRGSAALETALEKGPLDIGVFEGQGVRRYSLGPEGLVWQMVSSSDDIMEKAIFFKKVRDHNFPQQGKADFWSDPLLVNWMLAEGFKQHDQIYTNFQKMAALAATAVSQYSHVLTYLSLPQIYFSDIERVGKHLRKSGKGSDSKNLFIENFVVTGDSVLNTLDKIPDIENLFRGITAIHGLLKNENGEPLPFDDPKRTRYENTLAIELLGDPIFLDFKDRFKNSIDTTMARFKSVNDFVKRSTDGLSPDGIKTTKALIVYKFMELNAVKLAAIFEENQIPVDLGTEYIQDLLLAKLKMLPRSDDETIIRSHYIFWYAGRQEPRPLPRRDENMLVKGLVENNIFYSKIFAVLSEEDKRTALVETFKEAQKKEVSFRRIIRKLLQVFELMYNSSEYKFIKRNEASDPEKKWITEGQRLFLSACISGLLEGDTHTEEALERIIEEGAFPVYLRNSNTPENLRDFDRRLSLTHGDFKRRAETEKASFDRLVAYNAHFALFNFYRKPLTESYDIRNEIRHSIDITTQYFMSDKESNFLKSQEARIIFEKAVSHLVRKIIADFRTGYFPADYPKERFIFLVKVLEDSLKNL